MKQALLTYLSEQDPKIICAYNTNNANCIKNYLEGVDNEIKKIKQWTEDEYLVKLKKIEDEYKSNNGTLIDEAEVGQALEEMDSSINRQFGKIEDCYEFIARKCDYKCVNTCKAN